MINFNDTETLHKLTERVLKTEDELLRNKMLEIIKEISTEYSNKLKKIYKIYKKRL